MEAVYFGKMSKRSTERLMETHGRDGSYLLRDSESVQGALCLCVRRAPVVHTYRIEHSPQGWAVETVSGSKPEYFRSVTCLLKAYVARTPRNMEPPLYPLEKHTLPLEATAPDYWEM